jgi:flap endonuclease-1
MGVKLNTIIKREEISIKQLKGAIIAVDAPNIVMSLLNFSHKNTGLINYSNSTSHSNFILDRTQRPISHLYGLLYRVKFFYDKKIFPIFCFDGRVSPLKRLITKNQLNDFRVTQQRYQNAINSNNKSLARKIALSREYLWPNTIKESKQILRAIGVPVIEAPASAESQGAYLVKKEIADYSNSQDFDSLLFGCPHLLQNLSKSRRRKVHGRWTYQKISPLYTDLQFNLEQLDINQFQLVDLALMLKTDYFDGINGIGPKTALKLIKKYENMENIINHKDEEFNFSNLNTELITQIRKLFLLPEVIDVFEEDIFWNPPDSSHIFHLLCKDHFLNHERVRKHTKKLADNFYNTLEYFQYALHQPKTIQKTLDMIF